MREYFPLLCMDIFKINICTIYYFIYITLCAKEDNINYLFENKHYLYYLKLYLWVM